MIFEVYITLGKMFSPKKYSVMTVKKKNDKVSWLLDQEDNISIK